MFYFLNKYLFLREYIFVYLIKKFKKKKLKYDKESKHSCGHVPCYCKFIIFVIHQTEVVYILFMIYTIDCCYKRIRIYFLYRSVYIQSIHERETDVAS